MAGKKQAPDEYEILRDKILRGAFHPKQRLVETELAESLNSNRARIRRVLARLEHDGLVAIERYRGARVRMVSEEEAMEIFETRAVLEPYLVRQTVARATAADTDRLTALIREMKDALDSGNPVAVGRGSRTVREEMWRISGHQTISQLLQMLNTKLIRFWYRSVMVPDRARSIVKELGAVVEAIAEGSEDRASAAMARYHRDAIAALQHAMSLRTSDDDVA
ncbi:MAG TPA: GntR family transcriptional regulator [Burkholderiales bacterium]|nr:GntR family transcriptional regulator [Burkholderiales bacterium]